MNNNMAYSDNITTIKPNWQFSHTSGYEVDHERPNSTQLPDTNFSHKQVKHTTMQHTNTQASNSTHQPPNIPGSHIEQQKYNSPGHK